MNEYSLDAKAMRVQMPCPGAWVDVCAGANGYVAVGKVSYAPGIEWGLSFSENGKKWSGVYKWTRSPIRAVCYGKAGYVAISSENKVFVSKRGTRWTENIISLDEEVECSHLPRAYEFATARNPIDIYTQWIDIAGGPDGYVAIAPFKDYIAFSKDAVNWSKIKVPASGNWSSICYGNFGFLIVAKKSAIGLMSWDGLHWERIKLPKLLDYTGVCFGQSGYAVVAKNVNWIMHSTNGCYDWEVVKNLPSTDFCDICAGYGLENNFYLALKKNSNKALLSYGFDKFEVIDMPAWQSWTSVCGGTNGFVAVSNSVIDINYYGFPYETDKYDKNAALIKLFS